MVTSSTRGGTFPAAAAEHLAVARRDDAERVDASAADPLETRSCGSSP
jgi:hypothetical protein